MGQLGFLLMYRYGRNLSTGNIVTGVFVNIILVILGVTLLGEKINLLNAIGIALCILGVALISLHSRKDFTNNKDIEKLGDEPTMRLILWQS